MKGRISRPDREINRVVLPRVGFIKVGMKNAKGYPQSVDYFVPLGKYAGLFTQAYGDRPQTIQIVFPDDDAEKVCREEYQYRDDAGKLIAWGDGEVFNVWDGQKYNELSAKDYPKLMHGVARKYPNRIVRAGGDGWQVTLTLTFIIPLVRGVAGVWQFVTKGAASSIPGIRDTFDAMLSERGFVKGIIWDMNVQFAKSQKPGETSRYPVVSIVPNESEDNVAKVKEAWRPVRQIESK
mgnify:CR=1 FL=1